MPIGYTMHQRATVLRYLRAWGTSLESDPDTHAHVPEEAKAPVPQQQTSSDPTSQPDPSSDFGANEWLVEEMYEQFTRDPGSVDATWVAYFKANGNGSPGGGSANGAAAAPAPAATPEAPAVTKP